MVKAPASTAAARHAGAVPLAARLRARRAWLVAALVVADVVIIQASLLVLDTMRGGQWRLLHHPAAFKLALLATGSIVVAHFAVGLYDRPWERGRATMAALCLWGAALALGIFAAARTLLGMRLISQSVLLAAWAATAVSSVVIRLIAAEVARRDPPHRTLLLGAGSRAAELLRRIRQAGGREVVGFVDDDPGVRGSVDGVPVLGGTDEAASLVREHGVTEVVVATDALPPERKLELGWDVAAQGVRVVTLPSVYDLLVQQARIRQIRDLLAFELPDGPPRGSQALFKRGVDVALALFVVVALAPVWLLIALAIRLESRGPVIYTQERVGQGGRHFRVYKFRTMVEGAESDTGPVLARRDDPRSTAVGRVLRRLSLDELPQAMNVLRGQMSVVGPRPERPEFVEQYLHAVPGYAERTLVRPGVTGLAQVVGRYDTPAAEKLKYDLLYIRSASLLLDARIIVETVRMILAGRPRH